MRQVLPSNKNLSAQTFNTEQGREGSDHGLAGHWGLEHPGTAGGVPATDGGALGGL